MHNFVCAYSAENETENEKTLAEEEVEFRQTLLRNVALGKKTVISSSNWRGWQFDNSCEKYHKSLFNIIDTDGDREEKNDSTISDNKISSSGNLSSPRMSNMMITHKKKKIRLEKLMKMMIQCICWPDNKEGNETFHGTNASEHSQADELTDVQKERTELGNLRIT